MVQILAARQAKKQSRSGGSSKRSSSDTRSANREAERKKREMTGVALIAAGVLLVVYLFISATGVLGVALATVLFGLCGITAYALPAILIGMGILSIRGSRRESLRGSGWFVILGVLSLITLTQVMRNAPYQGVRYMDYLNTAYATASEAHRGGGFIGAVLCYPLQQFGGNALAYTLLIAAILASVVAVTSISLHDMPKKVADTVQSAVSRTRESVSYRGEADEPKRKMYVANLSSQPDKLAEGTSGKRVAEVQEGKPKKHKKRSADDDLAFLKFDAEPPEAPAAPRKKPKAKNDWVDIEPADDVPFVVEPLKVGVRTKKAETPPLPDTAQLFGAQEGDPPVAGYGKTPLRTPSFVKKVDMPMPENAPEPAAEPSRPLKKPRPAEVTEAVPSPAPAPEATEYVPPSFSLLNAPHMTYARSTESPNEKGKLLIETLANFGISAKVVNISVGPVLTRFELQPAPGVRISRITTLSNDIALALAAPRVRIEAPIPGKAAIGVEIPNKDAVTVVLRDIVESREFQTASSPITLAFGKDISGKVITADLAKMPHLLIAGSTGSGKSVCINDLIISMVYKSSPADLRLILVDPKMVELSNFGTLPHLLIPVVTDPKKAAGALRWAVNEMTQRYKKFSEIGARDLARYNTLQETPETRMPKIVVIIDELADLMLVAPDDVEDSICRIAQLGRASGIHLIVATQRPSADVITGLIKANIPSRCAFAVSSSIDSRIILDATGAEKLLGKGDMLFHPNGAGKPVRLQCAFVSDEEVERIVEHFRVQQRKPLFDEQIVTDVTNAAKGGATGGVFGEGKQEDDLLGEAVRIAIESGQASISMMQRRLRVGYARAARLVDIMEQHGYVSGFEGSKSRKVLIKRSQFEAEFGETLPPEDEGQKQDDES